MTIRRINSDWKIAFNDWEKVARGKLPKRISRADPTGTCCFTTDNEIVSVILGEWGEWGACSATCGIGKRSRETCKTEFKPGNTCPPRQVTTQIEECTVSCILSSSNVQGKFKGWQQEVMLTLLGLLEEMPGHQLSISLAWHQPWKQKSCNGWLFLQEPVKKQIP